MSDYRSHHKAAVGMGKVNMGKEFIHAREDMDSIFRFADSIGLLLLVPKYLENKEVRPKKPEELGAFSGGEILFYRPEWVFDEFEVMFLDAGISAGKYVVRTTINFSAISLYFQGDEDVAGVRRLGDGHISYNREWLHDKAHEMRLSPPEVAQVYKQVCKHLFSKVSVRGGVHLYHVRKQAAEVAARCETLPPFDYIPWPPPELKTTSRR